MKIKEHARAEQLLTASLKPFPTTARTYLTLGELFQETARPLEAERAYLEVIGIDPFDPLPHQALLAIYSDRKDEAKAAREQLALEALKGRELPPTHTGLLQVRSHPFAHVFLDGVDTGRTTPAQLTVAPGSHSVKLVNQERGYSRELPVEIGPNEEKLLEPPEDAGESKP